MIQDLADWYRTQPPVVRALLLPITLPLWVGWTLVGTVILAVIAIVLVPAQALEGGINCFRVRRLRRRLADSDRVMSWSAALSEVTAGRGTLLVELPIQGPRHVWWINVPAGRADPQHVVPTFQDFEMNPHSCFDNMDRQEAWAQQRLGEFESTAKLVLVDSGKELKGLEPRLKEEAVLLVCAFTDATLTLRLMR